MLWVAVEFIFGILFTFFCEVPCEGRMEEGLPEAVEVEEEADEEVEVAAVAGFCAGAGAAVVVCAAGCGFEAPFFCGSCAKAAEKKNRANTAVRQVVFMVESFFGKCLIKCRTMSKQKGCLFDKNGN